MGVHLVPRRWRTVAASVAGTSHAGAGQPCADACAVRVLPMAEHGALLVAVAADGAGTSEHAPDGARLACEAILAQAELRAGSGGDLSTFVREDVLEWLEAARCRIAEAARSRALEMRDFSCTLLAALVDEASAVFFQIGDGAVVYRREGEEYRPALWPQSGEYANCTWFVTDDDAAERVQMTVAENVDEVALLTDGLQGLALRFGSREAHGPFFEPMFARLRGENEAEGLVDELKAFLGSTSVNQRTDDDKTLALATRLHPPPREPAARP